MGWAPQKFKAFICECQLPSSLRFSVGKKPILWWTSSVPAFRPSVLKRSKRQRPQIPRWNRVYHRQTSSIFTLQNERTEGPPQSFVVFPRVHPKSLHLPSLVYFSILLSGDFSARLLSISPLWVFGTASSFSLEMVDSEYPLRVVVPVDHLQQRPPQHGWIT